MNEWLTAVLTRSGALTQGSVARVDMADGRGNWSTSGSLQLHYSPDAQGERPSRLRNRPTAQGQFSPYLPVYLRRSGLAGAASAARPAVSRCTCGHLDAGGYATALLPTLAAGSGPFSGRSEQRGR